MKIQGMKKTKNIFFIIVIIGILLKIFNTISYLLKLNSTSTISSKTTGLIVVGIFASIEIIALIVSLYFAWKNKITAYSWIGVLILYSLYKTISTMIKDKIALEVGMIPSFILWVVIIVFAFVLYGQFFINKQNKKNKK